MKQIKSVSRLICCYFLAGGGRSYPQRAEENLVCSLLSQPSSHLLVCAEHTGSGSTALHDDTCQGCGILPLNLLYVSSPSLVLTDCYPVLW